MNDPRKDRARRLLLLMNRRIFSIDEKKGSTVVVLVRNDTEAVDYLLELLEEGVDA